MARFGRAEVSVDNIKSLCDRKGWRNGRDGRLKPGNVPPNKGRRGYYAPGSEKGWFKKGQVPRNIKPMWHERPGKDGYIEMKVPERNPYTGHASRYRHKHIYLWEQANGPVPEGHRLKSLDGDRTNTDPANWIAVPKGLAPRLNGMHGRDYDAAPDELKPIILASALLAHKAAERDGRPWRFRSSHRRKVSQP